MQVQPIEDARETAPALLYWTVFWFVKNPRTRKLVSRITRGRIEAMRSEKIQIRWLIALGLVSYGLPLALAVSDYRAKELPPRRSHVEQLIRDRPDVGKEHAFGRSQVELFIRDRPGVGDVINRNLSLRRMLESSFEGDECTGPIYWDNDSSFGPADSQCSG